MRENGTIRAGEGRITSYIHRSVPTYELIWQRILRWLGLRVNQQASSAADNILVSELLTIPQDQSQSLNSVVVVDQGVGAEAVFTVKIRGRISADKAGRRVYLKAMFEDLTDGQLEATKVYVKPTKGSAPDPKPFEYICDLGRLNDEDTEIPNWLSVARIEPKQMALARKGRRLLRLNASVFCYDTKAVFAKCYHQFEYDNPELGYIDVAENIELSRALAVTLAFSLSAADGKMYKSEIDTIKQWAHDHIETQASSQAKKQLERAFRKTIRFFRRGYKIDNAALAMQLAEIAPAPQRYDIIEMCLKLVESKGFVSEGQVKMLKSLALWLDIDPTTFRDMLQRLAPANTHEVKDMELIFGLGEQMSTEQTRQRLNDEYRKWNARVTNLDPKIQNQAEQMLDLITEARSRYIG